ncbi:MAG: hypothetical protein V2I24_14940 [Halieaceae bacterium]|jgi:hypothetical protein|nr:hypothetical protein [Halieaceae bacterium]
MAIDIFISKTGIFHLVHDEPSLDAVTSISYDRNTRCLHLVRPDRSERVTGPVSETVGAAILAIIEGAPLPSVMYRSTPIAEAIGRAAMIRMQGLQIAHRSVPDLGHAALKPRAAPSGQGTRSRGVSSLAGGGGQGTPAAANDTSRGEGDKGQTAG